MTIRRQGRRAGALALALGLGLGLAACTPTGGWPGDGLVAGGGTGATSSATSTPAVGTTPTPGAPGATAAPQAPGAGPPQACLQGTWLADNDFWLASIREFGDEIKAVDGRVLLAFDDSGGYQTEYVGWRITAEAEGHVVTISREGTDTGEYTANDTTLSLRDTVIGTELKLSGAVEMTIAPEPASYANAPYTCGATNLTINTVDGELRMTRH